MRRTIATEDKMGGPGNTKVLENGKRSEVLKYIAEHGPSLLREISRTLAKNETERKQVYAALRDLVDGGVLVDPLVEVRRDGQGNRIRIWAKEYQFTPHLQESA